MKSASTTVASCLTFRLWIGLSIEQIYRKKDGPTIVWCRLRYLFGFPTDLINNYRLAD
jgi:hypothetical protein